MVSAPKLKIQPEDNVAVTHAWAKDVGSSELLGLRRQFFQLLYKEDTFMDKVFVEAEARSKLKREQMVYIAATLVALYLIFGRFAEFVCNLIGFGYPAYASVKAIRSETKDDDTQWLVYWTVFASFTLVDFFADFLMSVVPFYWLLKALFLLYLVLPQTHGATTLYHHVVNPFINKLDALLEGYSIQGVNGKKK